MVLIFTDNETLNKDLNKNIENSRIVYYTNYIFLLAFFAFYDKIFFEIWR